jgi:hypothetical protein
MKFFDRATDFCEFQMLHNIFLQPCADCESGMVWLIYSNLMSRSKISGDNPFTSSLYICTQVHTYKEYHSVCPLVGIGTLPTPSIASECAPPPGAKGGVGNIRVRVRGWGSPNSDHPLPSLSVDISFKDDVTVILLHGVFPSCLLFTGS